LVGPELSDAGKRFKRSEILRDLLEPSKVINPKFQTQIIETGDGEIITGIVVREDSTTIRLLKDPRETCEPKDIRADNIESRQTAKISMMPLGQMTTLSKDEILDLLGYIESGGDADAAMFKEK
jgi:putative heme-binding domain-containing protein